MTRKRQDILDALASSSSPLNAGQLHARVSALADLATVYRALHFFEQQGLVSSFVFECSERGIERYYLPRRTAHQHFMHCQSCHRFFPMPGCPFETVLKEIEQQSGFAVDEHLVTLKGQCASCR